MTAESVQSRFEEGVRAYRANEVARAIRAWEEVLRVAPDHLNAWQFLGTARYQQFEWQQAENCFRRAVELCPDRAAMWFNLAKVISAQGRWTEAVDVLQRGLKLAPNDARAWDDLGLCLRELGYGVEAETAHRRSLTLEPNDAVAWTRLGITLVGLGRLTEAATTFDRALTLDPKLAEAASNLGNVLGEIGKPREARAAFERALASQPAHPLAWAGLLLGTQYDADLSRADRFALHCRCGGVFARPGDDHANRKWHQAGARIRIGYVSSEFFHHAVARFLLPLLRSHDRTAFEIHAFANTARMDGTTEEMRSLTDRWDSIYGLPDAAAAALVARRQIDILVDLNGHSGFPRLRLLAMKPAPIQVTYLGYPDTTGLPAIDYRLTDDIADPPGMGDEFHAETLWRISAPMWCYEPSANSPPVRADDKNDGDQRPVVFGCFNNAAKLNPAIMKRWSDILRQVAESRLMLKARAFSDPATQEYFRQIFEENGVSSHRVDLRGWVTSPSDHLAQYHGIDIALDPFPYHGTTTTCDAIWMGVPVIVLAGEEHRSRVGVSLLQSIGLDELIAYSPEDYVQKAVALANNSERRHELRGGLRTRMAHSRLMDGAGLARRIEDAYRGMLKAKRDLEEIESV